MNSYIIVISKRGSKSPKVSALLKNTFAYTWMLASNKYNETWMCCRDEVLNIGDLTSAIKCLDKRIDGVFITKVIIESACYNNGGRFDEDELVDRDGRYHPGSKKMLDILMNKR